MENFNIKLDKIMEKMFGLYITMSKTPRDYGSGVQIYPADIHMIEAIGQKKDVNTTLLAEILGLTKGTVSKTTKRLEKKGFIKKFQYMDNKKEIYFKLTDLGERAYEGHNKFHQLKNIDIYDEFDNYSQQEKEFILKFVQRYSELLEKYID